MILEALALAVDLFAAKTFPRNRVVSVNVQTESGPINIVAREGDVKVEAVRPRPSDGKCELVVELKKGVLAVQARKPKTARLGDQCDAGFSVAMSARVTLEAVTGSGAVNVNGLRNGAKVKTGSGDVQLTAVSGKVHVLTGSGRVSAASPAKLLDVQTGSGEVAMTLETSKSEVAVRTGSGDITVAAPKGTRAFATLRSGSGDVTNEFVADRNSPLSIRATSGSGDVRLIIAAKP